MWRRFCCCGLIHSVIFYEAESCLSAFSISLCLAPRRRIKAFLLPVPWLLLQHLLPLHSVPFYKVGCTSAIQVNLIAFSLHYLWLMHLLREACKATNKVVNPIFSRRTSIKVQDEWSCWTPTKSGSFAMSASLRWMVCLCSCRNLGTIIGALLIFDRNYPAFFTVESPLYMPHTSKVLIQQ